MTAEEIEAPQPEGRAQRRAERSRRRLLSAALTMFNEKGVDATTIEDITEEADLGKGTFYRHFSSKDEIVATLVDRAVSNLVEKLELGGGRGERLEEVLEQILAVHVSFFKENGAEFVLLFQGRLMLNLDREVPEELERPFLHYLEAIERKVEPYLTHSVGTAKVRQLACALAGFVSGFFSFAMIGMTQEEIGASLEPLKKAFVAAASNFLGRQ